jgi:hypothetical protein
MYAAPIACSSKPYSNGAQNEITRCLTLPLQLAPGASGSSAIPTVFWSPFGATKQLARAIAVDKSENLFETSAELSAAQECRCGTDALASLCVEARL